MILSIKKTSTKLRIFKLTYAFLLCFALSSCLRQSEHRDDTASSSIEDIPTNNNSSTAPQGQAESPTSKDDEATTDVSVNPSDFEGTYEGTTPCEDCEGIRSIIVVNNNQTFRMSSEYIGKNKKIEDNGAFKLIDNGSVIHLKGKDTNLKLKVGEDKLFQLNEDDEVIDGEHAEQYIYNKKE